MLKKSEPEVNDCKIINENIIDNNRKVGFCDFIIFVIIEKICLKIIAKSEIPINPSAINISRIMLCG